MLEGFTAESLKNGNYVVQVDGFPVEVGLTDVVRLRRVEDLAFNSAYYFGGPYDGLCALREARASGAGVGEHKIRGVKCYLYNSDIELLDWYERFLRRVRGGE